MIMPLVNSQVSVIRTNVPCRYRRRCRAGRVITGRLQSIAALMCVTTMRVVVCLAIGALVTLERFGFHRCSRVEFL